jgi:hypothetical protein
VSKDWRWHRKPKDAADARLGVHADLAFHGFNDATGDRQTQSRPTEFSRLRGIGLHEFLENLFASVTGDSNARVLNPEP